MTSNIEIKKQQYQRLNQLFTLARQRYLDDGGNPQQSSGSHRGNDYLTDEEKQEIKYLANQVFVAEQPQTGLNNETGSQTKS